MRMENRKVCDRINKFLSDLLDESIYFVVLFKIIRVESQLKKSLYFNSIIGIF